MAVLTRIQKIVACSGVAVASLVVVPAVAQAAPSSAPATDCYTSCTPPTVTGNTVPLNQDPSDPGANGTVAGSTAALTSTTNGSSSLPFTGADIGELAAVGLGAVAVGGLLTRRRRRSA